ALQDATGNKPGGVVCEVPAKPQWCEIRQTVFSWTRTRFPLHIQSTRKLTINETPVVTVIGKAFWDIGHAPKDGSNRRKRLPDYAVFFNSFPAHSLRTGSPSPGLWPETLPSDRAAPGRWGSTCLEHNRRSPQYRPEPRRTGTRG